MPNIKPLEADEQEALFEWAKIKAKQYPALEMMFHIPNGGLRDKKTARALKRQGVKAGVPDICLPVARGGYHGLFIELKIKEGGKLSDNQTKWIESLDSQGYAAGVCHGWASATAVIEQYLNGRMQKE